VGAEHLNICRKAGKGAAVGAEHRNIIKVNQLTLAGIELFACVKDITVLCTLGSAH
jgi:hypothetical protein